MVLISRENFDSSKLTDMLKKYDDAVVIADKSVVDQLKWITKVKPIKFLVYSKDVNEEKVLKEIAENPPNAIYMCVESGKLLLYMEIVKVLRVEKYTC